LTAVLFWGTQKMRLSLPLYTIDLAAPPALPSTLEIQVCAARKWTASGESVSAQCEV